MDKETLCHQNRLQELNILEGTKETNRGTAQWHKKLQDYNFKIVHIAGKANGSIDTLSRIDQEDKQKETKLTLLIPSDVFLNIFEAGDPGMLEDEVVKAQQRHQRIINK